MKLFAFRVDASNSIGTGHVMRCLTLATQLRQTGNEVLFYCRNHPGNRIEYIESLGFAVSTLCESNLGSRIEQNPPLAHSKWLGVFQIEDAQEMISKLPKNLPIFDWLIVDHYALDQTWEHKMRGYFRGLMAIDDLADRQHDCDILLDQNFYINNDERYIGKLKSDCTKILGPEYALLRPEFYLAREKLVKKTSAVSLVLIFFGGSDNSNQTLKVLNALKLCGDLNLKIVVVLGSNYSHKESIREYVLQMGQQITLYDGVSNFSELMAQADLFIGSAGVTTWERCCLGLPSLVITVAMNQVEPTQQLDGLGVLKFLGQSNSLTVEQISEGILEFISDRSRLGEMATKAKELVDGLGVFRCIDTLISWERHEK